MALIDMRQRRKPKTDGRNWEEEIVNVSIEPCDIHEDPLGFRAIFEMDQEKARLDAQNKFVIGASFLAKRELNLKRAGYKAPMTHRAIELIETKLGQTLPVVLA